jgi:hypothetical protein
MVPPLHFALAAALVAAPLGGAVAGETFTVFDLAYKGSEQLTGPGGGTKPGDMLVWNNPLAAAAKGKTIGTSSGTCTVTSAKRDSYCFWTLVTPDGDVVGNGVGSLKDTAGTFVVVGGSGKYAGATGTFRWQLLEPPFRYKIVVKLN